MNKISKNSILSKDNIFTLIKENNFDEFEKIILSNTKLNLDIHDDSNNYLINYLINFNQIKIIKLILKKFIIRLDILDLDGRTILYNPIKYNNIELLKLLLEFNKKIIGISIIDIKDKLGFTTLHYAIALNNLDATKLLFDYSADPFIRNNNNDNALHIGLQYARTDIIIYFINNNISLDFVSNNNETFLQMAISYQNYEIIDLLLKKNININNQESEYGICALQQTIILNDKILCKKILEYDNININIQDFFGNTSLMYAVNDLNLEIIELLINQPNINFNLNNLEGNTALHILLLKTNTNINLEKFIEHTDLSLQNNLGDTCLFLLIKNNFFLQYKKILENKELNIFIKNLNNVKSFDIIKNNNKILNIIIESYYNQLIKNKNNLLIDWELWCSSKKKENNKIIICKKKIKDTILKMERSIPKISDLHLNIDNGILVNICFYTGSTIDILCGLIFLYNKFKKSGLEIIIDYPLTQHETLKQYYQNIGINDDFKLDIINFEIIWSFQKIIYPTYFNSEIKNKIKYAKYIIIPLGIETASGSHANILFWDIKNKIIERFEPNGSNQPKGINYNPFILDSLLFNKFKNFDNNIKYITPNDYLPIIGFQMLENFNTKCKKIGDPNGFCGVWCIWWIFQKLLNINIESSKLVLQLIKEIKYNNINFKTLIRNFSKNITDIRDTFLNKFNININDWISGNYDHNILNKIDKFIIDKIVKT